LSPALRRFSATRNGAATRDTDLYGADFTGANLDGVFGYEP